MKCFCILILPLFLFFSCSYQHDFDQPAVLSDAPGVTLQNHNETIVVNPASPSENALIFYPGTALKLNYCEDCTALELKVLAVLTALELKKIGKDRSSHVPCCIRSRLLIRYWILPSNKGVQAYDQSNLPP